MQVRLARGVTRSVKSLFPAAGHAYLLHNVTALGDIQGKIHPLARQASARFRRTTFLALVLAAGSVRIPSWPFE